MFRFKVIKLFRVCRLVVQGFWLLAHGFFCWLRRVVRLLRFFWSFRWSVFFFFADATTAQDTIGILRDVKSAETTVK